MKFTGTQPINFLEGSVLPLALCHRRWTVVQATSIFHGPKASPSILASSESTDGPPSSFGASNGGAAELDYNCLLSPADNDGLDRLNQEVTTTKLLASDLGLPPLGLNYIRIRAHCSFIGRCLRYFIRP
ncbi:hypothetical protein T05_14912 [Trichinella murrelli]|uniref:Uncharacterized protein n=1 Tax=Trichinella murrelli TaxID=144512 RepID=A0A0V0T0V4_9BILA|nr:hypothetical protein T05_14912 [Trichinella murrelli]